jgi:hypothetical protein
VLLLLATGSYWRLAAGGWELSSRLSLWPPSQWQWPI